MQELLQDLRFSVRLLAKNPSFTLVALVSLALAIGASTSIFSVFSAVLLKPLPFTEPDRLMTVWNSFSDQDLNQAEISDGEYLDLVESNDAFSAVGAYDGPASIALGIQEAEPIQIDGAKATASLFGLLGRKAALGRTFSPEDDLPGAAPVVILSDSLWRTAFGADPQVIGTQILLDGVSYQVIGVMPRDFDLPEGSALWLPFVFDRANLKSRSLHYFQVVGRLADGLNDEKARTAMTRFARRLQERNLHEYPRGNRYNVRLIPLRELLIGEVRVTLVLLFGSVILLLAIALANLGGLILARSQARAKELAMRAILGAGRTRLLRQFLTEGLLISLLGGGLGLLAAQWGTRLLVAANARRLPRAEEIGVDGTVLLFTFGVSLIAGALFGLIPVLQRSSSRQLTATTGASGAGAAVAHRGQALRNALIVFQIALALVLSIGAGLLVRSLLFRQQVDPGFRAENLLTFRVSLPTARYPDLAQRSELFHQATERLASIPGVTAAGAVSFLPLNGGIGNSSGNFEIEGIPVPEGTAQPEADRRTTTPGYFEAMQIPLYSGRTFDSRDQDVPDGGSVIVDDEVAKRFKGQDPVGRRIRLSGNTPWLTIVGLVKHVQHEGLGVPSREQIYFPATQLVSRSMYFVMRTTEDPISLVPRVRQKILELDRQLPIYDVKTMEERLAASLQKPRFASLLLGIFALVALILAAAGVFGIAAFLVTQRTAEIGIRMAMGARPDQVQHLITRKVMLLAVIGSALGFAGALAVTRLFQSVLYGVTTTDPTTFAGVVAILLLIAFVAAFVPARRAARIDPNQSLRQL